ncbi:MAG: RIP metalloprotease RseP [Bacteroidetes bacterium]|nr:RIP metalloprotease RseP [Bacteroidota bacterium]
METFIRVAQFLLSLSILVVLHEFGHYITARMFKTRVEKFYLFFDFLFPFPSVLNFALFKKKIGDTEYGLGWFPLGGYVKIAGMIDESMDEEFLKSEPKPDEFRSKKAWQRLIIMLGGIIVNVLLAFFIYSQMLYWWGESYLPAENAKYGYAADSTARKIGLEDGDRIISYNGGQKFMNYAGISIDMLLNNATTLEIERNGEPKTIAVPKSIYKEIMANKATPFVEPIFPCSIETLIPGKPLEKAGAKVGDRIIQLDTIPIQYFHEVRRNLPAYRNTTIDILALRGKDTLRFNIHIPDTAILGFSSLSDKYFPSVDKSYGLLASFPAGAHKTYKTLVGYIKQFRIVFDPELKGYKELGSFFTIGKQFSPTWDWHRFWNLTAFLSLALAFVNLLPIPALDGGHALFTLYEIVTGKAPNEKFLERAQVVGMVIIFGLMIFALGNDIFKIFFSGN